MTKLSAEILALAIVWVAVFLVGPIVSAWRLWRGTRIVTCPESKQPAAVDVDLRYAIVGSIAGRPELCLLGSGEATCAVFSEAAPTHAIVAGFAR